MLYESKYCVSCFEYYCCSVYLGIRYMYDRESKEE